MDRILAALDAGMFDLLPLESQSLREIAAIMRRYEDSGIQLADAALAYLAERENIRTVFTLDRWDFSLIRLKRNRALTLLPSRERDVSRATSVPLPRPRATEPT
jgi:predicted nucleic acid-binding protein